MLKNKVKELLKNKKVLSVCAFVVVAGGLAGATLALSSSATSVNEVSKAESVKSNEESNKQDNSKDNKVTSNKDTKKEESNNSSAEDKEVDTHVHEEDEAKTLAVANTGNTEDTNLNSSSSGTSTNTASTNSSSSVSNSNSSSNTNTGSSSSNTSNTNSSSSSNTVAPSEPSHDHTHDHIHNWVPITQQITHPEEGYWADELVSDAWTEEIPVYEKRAREICNGCGLDITEDPWAHADEQLDLGNYNCMGYHTEYRQFQVGTNTVHHDAIYSKKWIVSSPAWVETVTTGYQCSDCGAIQ